MTGFTGKVRKIMIEPGRNSKTLKCFLLVKDNNRKGFGEISVAINSHLVRVVLAKMEIKNLPIAVKVSAPNITKNGVVRLDDPETTLAFL